MLKLFRQSGAAVTTAVDAAMDTAEEFVRIESPLAHLPSSTGEYPASLTDDINLPLLVREVGARRMAKIVRRQTELTKELYELDKEHKQLSILLEAANSI